MKWEAGAVIVSLLLTTEAGPSFTDVAAALGVGFVHENSPTTNKYLIETMGGGVGLLDFDNDGWLDVFFTNGAKLQDPMAPDASPEKSDPRFWNRLYRNNRNGTFTDVTEKAHVPGTGYSMGVAVGDYDNDGFEDLYLTQYGGNVLYHNNGDGTFSDVTKRAGVAAEGWSSSAGFLDFDNDGRLDLFVCRYLRWTFQGNVYCGERRPGYREYLPSVQLSGPDQRVVSQQRRRHVYRRFDDIGHRPRRRERRWASQSRTTMATAGPTSSSRTIRFRVSCSTTIATAPSRNPR